MYVDINSPDPPAAEEFEAATLKSLVYGSVVGRGSIVLCAKACTVYSGRSLAAVIVCVEGLGNHNARMAGGLAA